MDAFLEKHAAEMGLELPETAAPAFRKYCHMLEEKNKVMNLTAIYGEKDIYTLHFLDCLSLLAHVDMTDGKVIDIGSGAGFPGLPIKLARPKLDLTMLDAQQKRVRFLSELCESIGTDKTECLHARAEEAAFETDRREQYDYAVSRAVARLNVLCELCLPFVKPGGSFISMKAIDSDDEVQEATAAIELLGGEKPKVIDYLIPGTDVKRRLVVIKKISPTPEKYPRRFAKINKSPLI